MFGAWLEREIERAGMNKSGFATVVGTSHTTVSKWITGERVPRDKYIPKIARALGLAEADVHQALGRIPKTDADYSEESRRLVELVESLSPEDRALMERMIGELADALRARKGPEEE
jgi:transcriptional regulator with XRE-family HTH domain